MVNDTLATLRSRIPTQATAADLTYTPELVRAVERTLADFLATGTADLATVDPALRQFAGTARQLVLAGGKRLRPIFAYWGWRGIVGPHEPVTPLLPALAALELMHTFALVHDDVMDNSTTRRGRPTAHRVFAGEHVLAGRRGDAEQFGVASAVLLGDLCLIWADQLLARAPLPATTLLAARSCYDRMRVEAVAGQYLDILGDAEPTAWSLERALTVARHKTAAYTVRRPLQFGAALAEPQPHRSHDLGSRVNVAYTNYGTAVGEAFQLRDDLLGVYGNPAVTGKPAGEDLRSGKPTALLMLAQQLATPAQRAELARCTAGSAATVGSDDCGGRSTPSELAPADIRRLGAVIRETGADQRLEALIRRRLAEGTAALTDAPIHSAARQALIDLAGSATERAA